MKTGNSGIKRILKAFVYSYDGFVESVKSEAAFRQELALCAVLLVAALLLPVTVIEKLFLISTLFLVLLMELINTAIEAVVDRVSDELHPLSKKAKDVGSLLVLVSFIYLGVVWAVVIYGVI
ncbi:MAG: diacylglycerol kinase [Campylobacteraceae bacterium]|jgi:diacylglycerol kinase (ATP)|nr:diacylglycerol kinase [Campylobacteraceae bacterium]